MNLLNSIYGLVVLSVGIDGALRPPRYISPWHNMVTTDTSTTEVTFYHGFGVYPGRAEVQVKSSSNYIFPGIRSGMTDNDSGYRGGVFCRYNQTHITLYGAMHNYIIYTGTYSWTTDFTDNQQSGDVRARVWHPNDLPTPTYTIPDFTMDKTSNVHLTKSHNLGSVPALTVVQLYTGGWVSEAIGIDTHRVYNDDWGGLVYAVSADSVRLWSPYTNIAEIGLFSFCDGWGKTELFSNCNTESAAIRIKVWADSDLQTDMLYSSVTAHSIYSAQDSAPHQQTGVFDMDKDLIMVTAEALSGNNNGYHFEGLGAVMLDIYNTHGMAGLVYGYNNLTQTFRLWHPVYQSSVTRCIIRVDSVMGNGVNTQCSTNVNVKIQVWKGQLCGYLQIVPANAFVVYNSTDTVQYQCASGFVWTSGDLTWNCVAYDTWSGTTPTCVPCPALETGVNVELDVAVLISTEVAEFTCLPGYFYVSGDLIRSCTAVNSSYIVWSGSPPVCSAPTTAAPPTTTAAPTTTTPTTTTPTTTTPTTTAPTTTTPTTSVATTATLTTAAALGGACFSTNSSTITAQEAEKVAEEIVANLTVPAKSTSKYKRSLECAKDDRKSSMYIGSLGAFICGGVFILIGMLDITTMRRHLLYLK